MSAPARRFGWPPQRCTCGDEAWVPCEFCQSQSGCTCQDGVQCAWCKALEARFRYAPWAGLIDRTAWIVQASPGEVRIEPTKVVLRYDGEKIDVTHLFKVLLP